MGDFGGRRFIEKNEDWGVLSTPGASGYAACASFTAFNTSAMPTSDLPPGTLLCVNTFFFSSRRRQTILQGDWSSDVCSSDLMHTLSAAATQGSTPLATRWPTPRESFSPIAAPHLSTPTLTLSSAPSTHDCA